MDAPFAVLFVHGFPLGAWQWEAQAAALAPRFCVLAPDLRGFGSAALGERPPRSIDDYADDLAALLRKKGIARAALVGFSMGGYVALALAERHPGLLCALVLANTRAGPDSEEAKRSRTIMAERARKEGSGPIADVMAERLFSASARARRLDLIAAVRARMAQNSPEGLARAIEAMRERPDRRPLLGTIRVPVLLIAGSEDALISPAEAEAMRAAIPGARLVTIEGAGHASNLERPEEFNRALLNFLNEVFS
jgi:pimeloyl-ACP methyl ester carboxylesterase